MQPKYQSIANELVDQIQSGKYRSSNRLPTEFVLMETYQVSRQTIRNALTILEKEGYIEKKRGSGSHIKRIEKSQLSSKQYTIAVVTTYISNYIFPSILREIEDVLSHNNCMTLLFATQNQVSTERVILQRLLNSKIDGIIVEGTKTALPNPNLDLYRSILEKDIPIVFINGNYPQLEDAVSVLDNNISGGELLVKYLHQKGHRKIAGIFKSDDVQGHGRYAGYTKALKDCSLELDDSLVIWYDTDIRRALLSDNIVLPVLNQWKNEGCTAVVCYNDEIACQLISFLNKANISIPDEMSVVSFDNSHLCEVATTSITSLSHEDKRVGTEAANKLLALLNGEFADSELLSWTIIQRNSS